MRKRNFVIELPISCPFPSPIHRETHIRNSFNEERNKAFKALLFKTIRHFRMNAKRKLISSPNIIFGIFYNQRYVVGTLINFYYFNNVSVSEFS